MRPEYFLPIVILLVFWFFFRLAKTHSLMDRLLRQLYTNHREIWEAVGRPRGWRWSQMSFSMFIFPGSWLRRDPDWLERTPELRDNFQKIREGYREWNFVAVPVFVCTGLLFALVVKLLNYR